MPALISALGAAVSVAAAVAARPPPTDQPLIAHRYQSLALAVDAVLEGQPVVAAFGEFHQTVATKGTPSALRRFTNEILPEIAGRLSHLVVETWVTTGRCGEAERVVTKDIERTTERPPSTENEIETLIHATVAGGIAPRILSITCADYAAMHPSGEAVDYDRTLKVTARALETAVLGTLDERRRADVGQARSSARSSSRPIVAVYGGALHNDVHPDPALGAYSFAPLLMAATLGRYVEVDLVVPEYVADSAAVQAQDWWRLYLRLRRSDAVVLIRRSPRSFVIVLPAARASAGHVRFPAH